MGHPHPQAGNHLNGPFLALDAHATGGTRFHDEKGHTLAWVKADIFPPVGTTVILPDGSTVYVTSVSLDLSSEDQIAQISVHLGAAPTPGHPTPGHSTADHSTATHSTATHVRAGLSDAVPATRLPAA